MINMTYFSPKRIKKGSIQIVRLYQTYAFNMAEKEGFEPSRLLHPTSFPSPPLQPLEYFSAFLIKSLNLQV